MKKYLWLLFMFIMVTKVEASEVFYSDYTDFSPYQGNVIEMDDCTNVISEDRYLWYKNEEILKDYMPYNKDDSFSEDCYLSQPTDWSTEKKEDSAYVYETRTKYEYTKAKEVRYIHLYDLQGSYDAFRITELMVMINGQNLNYSFTCEGCWDNFEKYINNGIYDENKSYIDNGGSLIIDLGKEYPLNQIEIVFYLFDLGPSEKLYTLGFADKYNNILVSKKYNLDFADQYWINALKLTTNIYDLNSNVNDWTYKEISYQNIIDDSIIDTVISEEYRYQVKWCRPYEVAKKYYPEYSKEAIDSYNIRDDSSKKTFYSYQTRDKLELNISEITNKNFDLNNFIVFSSDEVDIIENIDWNKNGNYDVIFKLNDIEVTKSIVLNIDTNTIEELKSEIERLNDKLKQLITDFNRSSDEYEQKISDLNQQLNDCQADNECLNKIIKDKNDLIANYEKQILNLSNEVNKLQVALDEEVSKVDVLIIDNNDLHSIIDVLRNEIKKLQINSLNLNQQLIQDYELKINNLIALNDFYKNKITELEGDLSYLNNSFSGILKDKDSIIDEYLEEITALNQQLDKKNNEYQQIQKDLQATKLNNSDLSNNRIQ